MKTKHLCDLLGNTNPDTAVLINLHGKLYEITTSVIFNGEDDLLVNALRVELLPISPPSLRKYEAETE